MDDLKMNNISCISAGKCVDLLSNMYVNYYRKKHDFDGLPSVMMWGAPGIGKSVSVKQIAKIMEVELNKKVVVTDVRLILFNPIDLRGIPTANEDKTLSVWLKPQIFQMNPSSDVINILFLDEISAAPLSVQAAAYQITLDKKVGEHNLPKNCLVIAAGNRTTDKSVAYSMPKALANRLLHIEVEAQFDSWNKWAIANGINEKVIGFLKFKPNYLNLFDATSSHSAFATPRTWEMVSTILNDVSSNIDEVYELVVGLVGKGVAVEFKSYCKIYANLPNIEDIFNGKSVAVPSRGDVLYALISSMLCYARDHKDDLYRIANSINFALKLPPDYSTILLKDYMYIEKDYKKKLLRLSEFNRWLSRCGKLVDELNK